LYGSGQRAAAVADGTQASWLALGIGGLVVIAGQLAAGPLARLLAGRGPVADAALEWLRIALFGAPFILVTLAGSVLDAGASGHCTSVALCLDR
jgi:Na+-driven multidrug efflux pump